MSRSPGRQYAYQAQTSNVPPEYYYDDTEGYVGDYSESDGLSDSPHLVAAATPDVKELYRRPQTVSPTRDHYTTQAPPPPTQNVYIPPEWVWILIKLLLNEEIFFFVITILMMKFCISLLLLKNSRLIQKAVINIQQRRVETATGKEKLCLAKPVTNAHNRDCYYYRLFVLYLFSL